LQWRDSCDVEVEVIAEVDPEAGPKRVEGIVDISVRGVEEDIDVLAVPGRGEPGQERSCAFEYPPVGVSGAEQSGEGAVIGELALEFVD
jgi:hypothetical protein